MDNKRRLSILFISLFSSWLLAFLFEGQILYAVLAIHGVNNYTMTLGSLAGHMLGLFSCGFFIKSIRSAKLFMMVSILYFIVASMFFFFPPSGLWHILIVSSAFLSGVCISSWGFFFRDYTYTKERLKTVAEMLIFSNVLMVALNMSAILVYPYLGLALSILMLLAALLVLLKFPVNEQAVIEKKEASVISKTISPIKPLAFLCLFIVIITINSGLMYRVVNPAFAHHQRLVSWYWALPYIIALFVLKNLPAKIDRSYVLYTAVAMIGLSFTAFIILDRSVLSYIIIDTLMLGAFGIYDLFWWSILGEMLDFHDNPSSILGIGLSSNVLGIFIGGILGNSIISSAESGINSSLLALVVVFVTLLILPLLHKHLSALLKGHAFLNVLYELAPTEQNETMDNFKAKGLLTERETEIATLLLRGRTYKMIADELFLSENTVKTHIKNIYSKFNIQSKKELIRLFAEK